MSADPVVRYRRRWWRPALAVGVAAVLLGIGLFIPSFVTDRNRPINSAEAIGVLNHAAAATLGAVDQPVGSSQYRYVETHAWWTGFSGYQVFQDENLIRTWVPADPADPTKDWMLDRRPTGNRVWIIGDEQQARDDGRGDAVVAGCEEEAGERSITDLVRERDAKLIAVLRATGRLT